MHTLKNVLYFTALAVSHPGPLSTLKISTDGNADRFIIK